jgi:thioredoxin-like negative regulator of GroEL
MKTARLQVLTTPAFRQWLRQEAKHAGVSVAELVRTRCEQRVGDEEAALAELTSLLRKEVAAARASVRQNLDEVGAILKELQSRHKPAAAGTRE